MNLNLKLVRHHDGKWKALPTENDLAEVSVKERTYAPIDPAQLLKALETLLSPKGGIKSKDDVPRLASLMKKFSKKLVSRCVYCNVLLSTEPDILSEYLDKGGWETVNTWLQYAKSSPSHSFLLEMLKLCRMLPMTLNRLKENNTAKLIKSLTKHDNSEVKNLSNELVTKWMSIIKGKRGTEEIPVAEKKKKKAKITKPEDKREEVKATLSPKASSDVLKSSPKLKTLKKTITGKEPKKEEYYEDVKIDEPPLPVPKKPRTDRPKTAKIYQKKFRATGLEEETPLPKNISKKTATVDKTALAAAKNAHARLNAPVPERIIEKKLKPESLMAIDENSASNKGIKLIPAKPRPTYMLQESASFMDALTSQPVAPMKRKKKMPSKASTSPTSPTITPPKFQFYKDTLEMSEENKKDSPEKNDSDIKDTNLEPANTDEPMDATEGGHTPVNEDSVEAPNAPDISDESKDIKSEKRPIDPNQLHSILSHGRRKGKKKSVKWVADENLRETFYFELDETERVNVLRTQNFGDLKTIEAKREREAIELAKRQSSERTEDTRRWWIVPILIDAPPPLVEYGCQSKEKEIQNMRQQSILQEIYFTRDMIPDSPHEPDLEIVPPTEPKIIPLDEENAIGMVSDFSTYEPPKPILPEVLQSLIKLNAVRPNLPVSDVLPAKADVETSIQKQPLLNSNGSLNPQVIPPISMASPYDPGEPVPTPTSHSNSLLGPPPVMPNAFNPMHGPDGPNIPAHGPNMSPQNDWRPQEAPPPDPFYGGFPPGPNMMPEQMPPMPMRPPGMNMFRPNMPKGGPPRGPRRRVPCRHYIAGGCRFGSSCLFLHPGFRPSL